MGCLGRWASVGKRRRHVVDEVEHGPFVVAGLAQHIAPQQPRGDEREQHVVHHVVTVIGALERNTVRVAVGEVWPGDAIPALVHGVGDERLGVRVVAVTGDAPQQVVGEVAPEEVVFGEVQVAVRLVAAPCVGVPVLQHLIQLVEGGLVGGA